MPSVRDLTIADRRGTVGVLASSCTTTTARTAPSAAAPPPSGLKSSRRRSPPPRPSTPPTTRAGSLSARRTPATAGSQPPRVWHDQRRPYMLARLPAARPATHERGVADHDRERVVELV